MALSSSASTRISSTRWISAASTSRKHSPSTSWMLKSELLSYPLKTDHPQLNLSLPKNCASHLTQFRMIISSSFARAKVSRRLSRHRVTLTRKLRRKSSKNYSRLSMQIIWMTFMLVKSTIQFTLTKISMCFGTLRRIDSPRQPSANLRYLCLDSKHSLWRKLKVVLIRWIFTQFNRVSW